MSVSILTASTNSSMYGSAHASRGHVRLMRTSHPIFGVERQGLCHHCLHSLPFVGHSDRHRQRNLRVEAGWLFKGGEQGSDARSEHSDSANEDILIFFYQLDLATRVQYSLNLEQYEIAKQLRNKLTAVEAELIKQQEARRGSASKSEAQDKAISILRLRADLQNAIENEMYSLAAELRGKISKLEADSLAASIKSLAYESAQYMFRLGQKVRHRKFGYRAVVCGMDPVCCESSSWKETAHVEQLSRGPDQPYYQVLVDVHADPNLLVAYVPEENLLVPDQPDRIGSIIPTVPFYSTVQMQLVISYLSGSCVRNTTGPDMRFHMIHRMTRVEKMLSGCDSQFFLHASFQRDQKPYDSYCL